VAVEAGRDLPGGLLVAAGQEEVLTAGREVRREPAADVAGADDGNRAIGDGHLGSPSLMWFPRVELERSSQILMNIDLNCQVKAAMNSFGWIINRDNHF
jgi:hypothetical protein